MTLEGAKSVTIHLRSRISQGYFIELTVLSISHRVAGMMKTPEEPPSTQPAASHCAAFPQKRHLLILVSLTKLQLMILCNILYLINRHQRLVWHPLCPNLPPSLRNHLRVWVVAVSDWCAAPDVGLSNRTKPHVCLLPAPLCVMTPSQTWWQGFDFAAVASGLRDDQWKWSDSSWPC